MYRRLLRFAGFQVRARGWAALRRRHLKLEPVCQVCGSHRFLDVHHIVPVSEAPELELDPDNLITLGRRCPGGNHHLVFGHAGVWQRHVPRVRAFVAVARMHYRESLSTD